MELIKVKLRDWLLIVSAGAPCGRSPSYTAPSDGKWVSTDDYFAGDGTLCPAGTVLRDPAPATAAAASDLADIGSMSSDLVGGFTNAWYQTMDREPFEPVLNSGGDDDEVGPRWRLEADKYGQDLPSVPIPVDPSLPPPPTKDQVKYEAGEETQAVINLMDWDGISPLTTNMGWLNAVDGRHRVAIVSHWSDLFYAPSPLQAGLGQRTWIMPTP